MDNGWIKIQRQMLDWEWWDDAKTVKLFIWLILKANHETGKWKGNVIERGQLITGRLEMVKELSMTAQEIRSRLTSLKSTSEITIKTTNKFSLITVNNYSKYQDSNQQINSQNNQQTTNKQPTNNHKQELKELKELKEYNNINEQDKKLFQSYEELCVKKSILNQIGIKKYLEMRGEYEVKVNWWIQIQACINWLSDNKKKTINASRLRNWMERSIRFAKDKQIKDQQHFQDKQNQLKPKIKTLLPPLWTPPV